MTEQPNEKVCPQCRTTNQVAELKSRDYRCAHCGLELAHLDTAANGAIRGVFGWLLDVGQVVNDRYRIAAVLGKGGFGVTYLVDDLRLHGKRRALKEIPELLFDEHETKLLGRLSHPAIPDITDRSTRDGMVYLVLEFGGSRTLRIEQERQGGRIPVFALLPLVEQICAALTYLHAQDPPVVHRDLKPENILLDDNERVMLIDFGIAKESSPDTVTRTLGRAVTHGFSPPEQVLGTGTDARSDVYALGAIVYSMLTGQTPTPAHERVVGKVLEPPSRFVADIPPLLDAAVVQALELNINARQQSIEDFARALSLVQTGSVSARTVFAPSAAGAPAQISTSSQPRLPSVHLPSTRASMRTSSRSEIQVTAPPAVQRPRPKSRAPFMIAAVVVAALGAGGAWLFLQREEPKPAAGTAQSKSPEAEEPAAAAANPASVPGQQPASLPGTGARPDGPPATASASPEAPQVPPAGAAGQQPSATPAPPRPAQGASPHATPPEAAANLPSIFSSEQKPATAPAGGGGSLMDIFDKRRATQVEEPVPAPEPEPAVATPPPPRPSIVNEPIPAKQTVTAEPPPKRRSQHRRQSSPSSSGWTINYQGARKTD